MTDSRAKNATKTTITVALPLLLVGVMAYHSAPVAGSVAVGPPVYVVTHVDVMPKYTEAGRELLKQFAVTSRGDAGSVRIEVLEELLRPNHSTIVEVWKDRKAYDDHLEAEPTRSFRAKLQPMLGSPFDERLHGLSTAGAGS
jgi:quinol monooxygenase YgiN